MENKTVSCIKTEMWKLPDEDGSWQISRGKRKGANPASQKNKVPPGGPSVWRAW